MSPTERKLWLAKHHAPANMLLITSMEIHVLSTSLAELRQQNQRLLAEQKKIQKALRQFCKEKLDLLNVCQSAVFEENRKHQIAIIQAFQELVDTYYSLAPTPTAPPMAPPNGSTRVSG